MAVMIGRGRGLVVAGASVAVAIWLNVNGPAAQVPDIPAPPDPSTAPTTVPPHEAPAPTPGPPPAPTDTTLPPGSPGAPPTPVGPGPAPGTTTTTVPAHKLNGAALPPARTLDGSAPAAFGLDLSEIDALRRAARGKGPRAPEPDYGFDPELRFRSGADAGTDGSGEEALELGAEEEEIARVRSASAVAAGFMALLLMGVTRGLLRQARPARPRRAGD